MRDSLFYSLTHFFPKEEFKIVKGYNQEYKNVGYKYFVKLSEVRRLTLDYTSKKEIIQVCRKHPINIRELSIGEKIRSPHCDICCRYKCVHPEDLIKGVSLCEDTGYCPMCLKENRCLRVSVHKKYQGPHGSICEDHDFPVRYVWREVFE